VKRKRFAEIVESAAGAVENPCVKQTPEDAGSEFIGLAGSVAVPPEKKGTSWKSILAATWRHRAKARK